MVFTVKTGCKVAPDNSGVWGMKMKYVHNEVHDKTVGEIIKGGFGVCIDHVSSVGKCGCTGICPLQNICNEEHWTRENNQKRQRVIEYIAEEVADFLQIGIQSNWRQKYGVDLCTANEIIKAADMLLESKKQFELKEDQPTTADAFYVYNADLEKCVTVSREQDDDIIDLTIHNEMDIATARVFCKKLSSFLDSIGGEK